MISIFCFGSALQHAARVQRAAVAAVRPMRETRFVPTWAFVLVELALAAGLIGAHERRVAHLAHRGLAQGPQDGACSCVARVNE